MYRADNKLIELGVFPILHGAATVETGTHRLFQDALTLIPFNLGEIIRRDTVVVSLGDFR